MYEARKQEMTVEEFTTQVKALRPLLTGIGKNLLDSSDTEDMVQETLMRLWLMRERIRPDESLRPLAARIARNVCVDMHRRRRSQRTIPIDQMTREPVPSEQQADNHLQKQEMETQVKLGISHLSPSERRLFSLSQDAEMDIQRMATVTGLQPRSVSAILSTARRKLMNYIKKEL